MNIGQAVKHMREKQELTQEQLSQALGIDRTRVIRLEQQQSMRTKTLEEIAEALNIKPSDIMKQAEAQN